MKCVFLAILLGVEFFFFHNHLHGAVQEVNLGSGDLESIVGRTMCMHDITCFR
jgi:hypothetical protein